MGGNNNGSFSGAVALNGGTLQITNDSNASPLGTGTLTFNGGTLTAGTALTTNPITNAFTVASNSIISGSNNVTLSGAGTLNSGTLSFNNTGTVTLSGTVIGSGNLTVNNGTLNLAGNNTGFSAGTSYAGLTTVNAGAIATVTNANALGFSSVNATGGTLGNNGTDGGVFNINGVNVTTGNTITLSNGEMTTTGTAQFNGPIILANGTGNTLNVGSGSIFTYNENINGPGGLVVSGGNSSSTWNMNGNQGTTTPLSTYTVDASLTHVNYGGTTTITTGDQTYNTPISLVNDAEFNSQSGNVIINGAVSGTTALGFIISAGGNINLNGGSVATVGSQTYNGTIVLGTNTAFSTSGSNTTIALGNVTGSNILNITGSSGTTLSVNTGAQQTWNINSSNSGNLVGGPITYSSIDSLVAGSGNNTLVLGSGVNTVNINAANAGSVTGSSSFSNIANITGNSNSSNTFVIGANGSLSGTINANSDPSGGYTNTIDLSSATAPVQVNLQLNNNTLYNGSVSIGGTTAFASYSNVDTLIGNSTNVQNNIINLPSGKSASDVHYSNGAHTAGYIGDPTFFTNFTVNIPGPPTPPVVPSNPTSPTSVAAASPSASTASATTTSSSAVNVAPIIQQPAITNQYNTDTNNLDNSDVTTPTQWNNYYTGVNQSLTQMITDIEKSFDTDILKVKINPYCYTSASN